MKFEIYKQPYGNGFFWKIIGFHYVFSTRSEARTQVRHLKRTFK